MRITVVEFSPSGGLYQFALQLADAYAAAGHEVELLTGREPELRPREPGVRLLAVLPTWHPARRKGEPAWIRKPRRALRAGLLVLAWLQVAGHLRRSRPDVVQWAEWRFPLDGWFVARIARSSRAAMADVAHTPRPFAEQRTSGELYKTSSALLRALGRGYAAMDVVLVLGESAKRDLLETFPQVRRVEVIPHGDEAIFAAGQPDPQPAGSRPPQVLFFGTLARYKGLDLLLDAFARVRERLPAAELLIAGAVADVELAPLRRRAADIGGVDLRAGYIPAGDVAGLISDARVVVAPYVIANQSGVAHLAQTFARPVVATDVGDLGVAVRDGETGLLVPPGDAQALADALVALLTDAELATRLGAGGLVRSKANASWKQVAEQVLGVYAELVAAAA